MNIVGVVLQVGLNFSQTNPDLSYLFSSVATLVGAGATINFIILPKLFVIHRGQKVTLKDFKKPTRHEGTIIRTSDWSDTQTLVGSDRSYVLNGESVRNPLTIITEDDGL